MTASTEDAERIGVCLVGFQARDHQACKQFDELLRPYLRNLARKVARDLPDDLQEDVVQQACLDLISNSTVRFDPRRGSAKAFLFFAVRNALRTVRSNYCPPGVPTRLNKSKIDYESSLPISTEELAHELGTLSAERQMIARLEANSLLKKAPPRVATALQRIHYFGDSLNETASNLNVSRFKLSREISAYRKSLQFTNYQIVTAYRFVC